MLSHVTVQMRALDLGTPMDLMFQSFAGSEKANKAFGISVGLMDDICPPSTVFAAYNYYGGPKEIKVWQFNNHEGGGVHHAVEKVNFINKLWR